MVINGFSSLIRGIFYTIGKIIAFILIGLLIGFLAVKFNIPIKNLVMMEAHAQENISGAFTLYNKWTSNGTLGTGYDNTNAGISYPNTSSWLDLPAYTGSSYRVVTAMDLQANYNFVAQNDYTLRFHFENGGYVHPAWPYNSSQSWFIDTGGCPGKRCTTSWTYVQGSLDLTINFTATSNSQSVLFVLGNFSDNMGMFYNAYTSTQGLRISSASLDEVDNSINFDPIIDNDNQNTQNIINNNNTNTQNIINNQNQNTQDTINSQKVCRFIDKSNIELSGKRLSTAGVVSDFSSMGITSYIPVSSSSQLIVKSTTADGVGLCFYDVNKDLISCLNSSTFSINQSLSIPANSSFLRATIRIATNVPTFELCTNGNQALSDDINDLNNTLKDDNLPDVINSGGGGGTYFDDLNESSDTPISDLLLLPLNLLNKVSDNLSSTCTAYTIPFDFTGGNNTLTFPCINIENYVGSNLWGVIDAMFSIFMIYNIFRLIVRFYDSWTSLDDTYYSFLKGGTN